MVDRMAVRIDKTKALSFEEVASPEAAARFEPLESRLDLGFLSAAAWLRLSVHSDADGPAEWWMELQPGAYITHASLYIPDATGAAGGYTLREAGTALRFSAHELSYRNPVFKLTLPPGVTQTFYLRLESKQRIDARATFWHPDAFIDATGREQFAFGFYLGVYALLVLASLWFEMAVRDRVYLYFALYVSACILSTLTSTGLWRQYVIPESAGSADTWIVFSISLLIASCMQFLLRFVDMARHRPQLSRIYLAAVWLLCGLTFGAAVAGHTSLAMHVFGRVMVFVVLPCALVLLWRPAMRSAREIRYALMASGLFLVFGFISIAMAKFNVIRPNFFTDNAMYITSMAFLLIIYYAMSRRYNTMRLAKEEAHNEALRVSQRAARDLEQQVEARAKDLVDAMHEAQLALAHARTVQQEQRNFISTVSHELRTPLAVIHATAHNLTRELRALSPKGLAKLEKIQQATNRLSLLFDDYLNEERLADLSAGVQPRWIDLLPQLENAIEAAKSLTDRHALSIDAATPPLQVWADPRLVQLVLRTLVDNAVKYSPPGARVVLSARYGADGCQIDVNDTGCGISEGEWELIFDRYYRGRASGNRIGTGLGLPLARYLVEMHGGSLRLLSSTPDGTCFRILLPFPDTPPPV